MGLEFHIRDNSGEVYERIGEATERALTNIGKMLSEIAAENAPVDTGHLAQSITYLVDGDAVYVGVPKGPTSYGLYVEMGTGIYAAEGGRPTPWVYQDAKGDWHWTRGNPAQPFLAPAVKDNMRAIRETIEEEMKNG